MGKNHTVNRTRNLGLKNNKEKPSNCRSRETLDKVSGVVGESLVLEVRTKGWTKIDHKHFK